MKKIEGFVYEINAKNLKCEPIVSKEVIESAKSILKKYKRK